MNSDYQSLYQSWIDPYFEILASRISYLLRIVYLLDFDSTDMELNPIIKQLIDEIVLFICGYT